jgi:hypothetical protein
MRADIHDGPEHKPLQSEAGYIDARPQCRQIDETLLRRTAGPYIRVTGGGAGSVSPRPLYLQLRKSPRPAALALWARSGHHGQQEIARAVAIILGCILDIQIKRNPTVGEQAREIRSALCCRRRGLCRAFEGRIVTKHKHDDGSDDSAA